MPACDEPGDGSFDHGSPLPVVVGELACIPCFASCDEFVVVGMETQCPSIVRGGAPITVCAVDASDPEHGVAVRGEVHGLAGGTRNGPGVIVDNEVVATEPVGHGALQWHRLDRLVVARGAESCADSPRSVGAVGEDLQAGFLTGQKRDTGRAVTDIRSSQRGRGDQPGVRLDRDVCLVTVAVFAAGLVHVTGFGIDRRDHPIRHDSASDPPRPVHLTGFDILAGDQCQQPDRVGLGHIEDGLVDCGEDRERIVDEARHQRVLRVGVVPRTHGFA